jgi:hypothetical protein
MIYWHPMADSKPWLGIPSIQNTQTHPNELARQLAAKTGRQVVPREFAWFCGMFEQMAKSPRELWPYGTLTYLFPRCIQAVLDGDEPIARTGNPLMLLIRQFPGCTHGLAALYETHPLAEYDSPWNDALQEHVRIWTWERCEICAAAELARTAGVQ